MRGGAAAGREERKAQVEGAGQQPGEERGGSTSVESRAAEHFRGGQSGEGPRGAVPSRAREQLWKKTEERLSREGSREQERRGAKSLQMRKGG